MIGRRLGAAVVAMAALVAACGGDNSGSNATTTTAPPATTAPPVTTAPPRRPATGATRASCRRRSGRPTPRAGNIYIPLVLKNTGSRTCSVAGFPGVSLLDAAGAQIGQPATRETGFPEAAVKLAPGAQASTALHTANEGIAPGGCLPPSAKVRVFPPNELDAIEIAGTVTVCGNLFSLSPLVAGTSGR